MGIQNMLKIVSCIFLLTLTMTNCVSLNSSNSLRNKAKSLAGFEHCANEGGNCQCNGMMRIGSGHQWLYRVAHGEEQCSMQNFPPHLVSSLECEMYAKEHKMPFSTQGHSNGAPAGCMRYDDGRVIFVETCKNHPNCGTMNCNGCKVVTDFEPSPPSLGSGPFNADECEAYAKEHKMPFSTQGHSNGAPAGCMRYDDGRVIFVEHCR